MCFERPLKLLVVLASPSRFINNLVQDLSKELSDLAEVYTFHGFCKRQLHALPVAGLSNSFRYYPPFLGLATVDAGWLLEQEINLKDLETRLHGLDDSGEFLSTLVEIGNYYDAVSHTDSVYRVVLHFESCLGDVPSYSLVVVDEYQDFSFLETSLIAQLAHRSPVIIAGDDDQALYSFKNASPQYLRVT